MDVQSVWLPEHKLNLCDIGRCHFSSKLAHFFYASRLTPEYQGHDLSSGKYAQEGRNGLQLKNDDSSKLNRKARDSQLLGSFTS